MIPLLFITKLDLGGMERVCTTLCNEWTAQGRAFLLYVSYEGGGMRQAIHAQEQVYVANKPARRAVFGLARLCRKHADSPALVFSFELGVVLVVLKMFGIIRNRIILRESTAIMSHCSIFWRLIYRLVGPSISGIIAQSQKGLDDLALLFKTRHPRVVVHNPCAFASLPSALMFERRNNTWLRLLMVGRLAPMKGHVRVLNAMSMDGVQGALQKGIAADWRFSIVGGGPCQERIEKAITALRLDHHVEMNGAVSDVRPFYARADLFVLASDYEGLPNALIEALACGCRVLVVEGDGGTTEFMRSLGLASFVFSPEKFERSFWACVKTVLESDVRVWHEAYQSLVKKVSPGCVADQIWEFMGAPRQGEADPKHKLLKL
jgi:glycosyltransferase involved in cell wall biosynthesis